MKVLFYVFIGCIFFIAIGCSPVYYKPNLMNMPNFRQQGNAHFAASACDAGGDIQAAYAFSDHFLVQPTL